MRVALAGIGLSIFALELFNLSLYLIAKLEGLKAFPFASSQDQTLLSAPLRDSGIAFGRTCRGKSFYRLLLFAVALYLAIVLLLIGLLGAIGAILGSLAGLLESDIKKVIADTLFLGVALMRLARFSSRRWSAPSSKALPRYRPPSWRSCGWRVVLLGAIGAILGPFARLLESDIKKIIAYPSISHMNLAALAFASVEEIGRADRSAIGRRSAAHRRPFLFGGLCGAFAGATSFCCSSSCTTGSSLLP